jgi:hypothetical protein
LGLRPVIKFDRRPKEKLRQRAERCPGLVDQLNHQQFRENITLDTVDTKLLSAIGASATPEALQTALDNAAGRWGFETIRYLLFTSRFSPPRAMVLHRNLDPYEIERLCMDPFVSLCRGSLVPVFWQSEIGDRRRRRIIKLMSDNLGTNTTIGMTVPLQGPKREFGLLEAFTRIKNPEWNYRATKYVHQLHAAALVAHEVVVKNCENERFAVKFESTSAIDIAAFLRRPDTSQADATETAH